MTKRLASTALVSLLWVGGLQSQEQQTEPTTPSTPEGPSRAPRGERPARRERAPRGERTGVPARHRSSPAAMELAAAVEAGDLEKVKASLQADPALVNSVDRIGRTPLYMAAQGGHKEIAEFLLASGAEVDGEAGRSLSTPLEVAAELGQQAIVELLILQKANVNHQNDLGKTPLAGAAENGHTKIIEMLLAAKADINLADKKGQTPLDQAEKNKKYEAGDFLFARGGTGSNIGRHFVKAAAAGDIGTVKKLLALNPKLAGAQDNVGNTALHVAKTRELAEALLAAGATTGAKNKAGAEPFAIAAADGRKEVLELFLANGENVNASIQGMPGVIGMTTMMQFAAANGHAGIVTLLLAYKVELNIMDGKGRSPLDLAVENEHATVAALLRKQGAWSGLLLNELHGSAGAGDLEMVKKIVLADPRLVNARGQVGFTALLRAAMTGQRAVAEFLLANKADVHAVASTLNAIGWARRGKHEDLAQFLIQYTEDHAPSSKMMFDAVEAGDLVKIKKYLALDPALLNQPFASWSPLQIAIRNKQKAVADFLLASKADVNTVDDRKDTPLHEAGSKGDPEVVDKLLARGAQLNALNKYENTPLDAAVRSGNYPVATHLRTKGATGKPSSGPIFQAAGSGDVAKLKELISADPKLANFQNEYRGTPLARAAVNGRPEAVAFLLAHGADPNASDKDGLTPLMVATTHNHTEIVALLLDKGAIAGTQQSDGTAALHTAKKEVTVMLVERNADVNVKTASGYTPLHSAAGRGDMDTVEFLVSHNAEVNARTKDGETPLDNALHVGFFDNDASKAGKAKIVPFLREHGGKSGKELQ